MAKVEIRETVTASVSPEVLWEALFNPLPLRDCLPGATVFERVGEHEYRLVLELSTAVINGSYGGTFHVAENKPYDYFRLAAKASGPLGKVRAIADVNLTPIATGTRAAIAIRADLSGVLGFVGPPAAGLVGRWMVDRFFECIDSVLKKRTTGGCEGCGGGDGSPVSASRTKILSTSESSEAKPSLATPGAKSVEASANEPDLPTEKSETTYATPPTKPDASAS